MRVLGDLPVSSPSANSAFRIAYAIGLYSFHGKAPDLFEVSLGGASGGVESQMCLRGCAGTWDEWHHEDGADISI